jgi:hypothetical protein
MVTPEEHDELLRLKQYESFMDCSGQYDDKDERVARENSSYAQTIKLLKLKHAKPLRYLRYPYDFNHIFKKDTQ